MSDRLDTRPEARLHVQVTGRVQGVGFRAHVQVAGRSLNLTGWVRNVGMDQVEALAEGPRPDLERFLQAVRTGPRGSHVEACDFEWLRATGEYGRFEVRSSR